MINQTLPNQATTEDLCARIGRLVLNAIDRLRSEQTKVRRQAIKKRQTLNEYQEELLDGMPLHERLKPGNYRF